MLTLVFYHLQDVHSSSQIFTTNKPNIFTGPDPFLSPNQQCPWERK